MNLLSRTVLSLALTALPMLVFSQQKPIADPSDPKVSVPPVLYVSPLKAYQPLGDEAVSPWKNANEAVEKAGGWKAYAKEAQEPDGASKGATPILQSKPQSKPAAQTGPAGPKN